MYRTVFFQNIVILAVVVICTGVVAQAELFAAQLTLTWTDNAKNESGLRVERRIGNSGSYSALASLPPNTNTYVDKNLPVATTFCYRVNAYNAIGSSGYSNEACATTALPSYSLLIKKIGTGSGTVTATGINCGSDCSELVSSGTQVNLTATPAPDSIFAGWSGNNCGTTVMVTGNITCTATFTSAHTLTVAKAGTGSGTIIGPGITCGSDCSEAIAKGKQVELTPLAAAGSTFAGWSGQGCGSTVTLSEDRICTATFKLNSHKFTVVKTGTGKGTVTATGINCGNDCSEIVTSGSQVVLTPQAASGSSFAGWTGAGCGSMVTVTADTTCTAIFHSGLAFSDRVGIYRPSTGEWLLDLSGNAAWDDCETDLCVQNFTAPAALPLVGAWDATGLSQLGLYSPETGQWYLDKNTNETWEGCEVDLCGGPLGEQGDIPVVGKWLSDGNNRLGIYRPDTGYWYLDEGSDGSLGSCRRDQCAYLSVYVNGDLPVVGDWNGDGTTKLGLFRPSTGQWFLDSDGNKSWNSCANDRCVDAFGSPGDRPVVGDWNGSGKSSIGIFRPGTSEWFLDFNDNGTWDGCGADLCVTSFGAEGDIPVVGKW
jgi:Divergent InlB B-repeat domain